MTTTVLELHMEECVVVLGWVEEKNMAGERRWPESVCVSLSLVIFSPLCLLPVGQGLLEQGVVAWLERERTENFNRRTATACRRHFFFFPPPPVNN